jgi:uncharacterized protein (TIGR04255 family)
MANAPLALVLAQLRFSPYLSIGSAMPSIQDALRKSYPVFRKSQIQTLEFGPGPSAPNVTTVERFNFVDADNREGFITQQDSLVFAATRYRTFDDFAAKHRAVLECFERLVPDLFVERLGLRYVDVVVPQMGERPEQYVVEGLQGCHVESIAPVAFQSQYVANWKLSDGAMKFRFVNGVRKPFMPPDLQPIELDPAEVIAKAIEASKQGTPIGLLDFDRVRDHRGTFKAAKVLDDFAAMHGDASQAFKRAMSSLARMVWNSANT